MPNFVAYFSERTISVYSTVGNVMDGDERQGDILVLNPVRRQCSSRLIHMQISSISAFPLDYSSFTGLTV